MDRERKADEEDLAIVAALGDGDRIAAKTFHDRVRPALDRTLRRLLGLHDADYDDLLQESLVELVRSAASYRAQGSLDGWVSVVTARVVYRHIRDRQSERRVFDASATDLQFETAHGRPEEEALARDLLRRIRTHLDRVEETKAWTYLLHDVAGYELAEIAEITGVTVAAAQSRLVRGRKELDALIAADPELAELLKRGGSQ